MRAFGPDDTEKKVGGGKMDKELIIEKVVEGFGKEEIDYARGHLLAIRTGTKPEIVREGEYDTVRYGTLDRFELIIPRDAKEIADRIYLWMDKWDYVWGDIYVISCRDGSPEIPARVGIYKITPKSALVAILKQLGVIKIESTKVIV